jgi:PAS domain S-box-containing protein
MKKEDETIEKLLTIEKAINEMVDLRQRILELKESETQRQEGIEALRASEKQYRTLIENLPQKLFLKDRNSVYTFCNQNYAADLKIKPEEISGKTDYDFFPQELAEKYISTDQKVMEAGQLENIEEKYIHNGETSIVHMVKTPVRDERGEPAGILGIFWDITEQKRNEEEMKKNRVRLEELVSHRTTELQAVNNQMQKEIIERRRVEEGLQEMEETYRALLESTGTATVVIGEDMLISLANAEFGKLSGYSKEEVEGKKSFKEFFAQDDSGRIQESNFVARTNLDPVLRHIEGRFVGREGVIRDVQITTAMIPGAKKAVASLLDITDRKRTEGSLRALEERYQAFIENANEAILVIQKGWLKFYNSKIFRISGYTKDELTSKPYAEFIHPADRERFRVLNQKVEQGELPSIEALRMIDRDGNIRWLQNRGALIHWEGKPALLNFMTDVTDRKQTEEELRNSIEPFRALVNAIEKMYDIVFYTSP